LRHVFVAVAIVAISIVLFRRYDPTAIAPLLFIIVLIGLHVAGNALGTRLRSSSTTVTNDSERSSTQEGRIGPGKDDFAPPTKLSYKSSLGWPLSIATCAGVVIGALVGYSAMSYFYGDRLEIGAIVIGEIAAMALGGFWFFWCWSFAQVVLNAWWHAHSSATNDHKRRR
jgi:hypothetical protein